FAELHARHSGWMLLVTRKASPVQVGFYLYHSATPPCREHAPRCCFAWEYVPSLHLAVAPSGAPAFVGGFAAALGGVGGALGGSCVGGGAAIGAFVFVGVAVVAGLLEPPYHV